jgi:hypothetical protein
MLQSSGVDGDWPEDVLGERSHIEDLEALICGLK